MKGWGYWWVLTCKAFLDKCLALPRSKMDSVAKEKDQQLMFVID